MKARVIALLRSESWPGAAAFAVLWCWYICTMSRDVLFFDTGELALVARDLGVSHPPGQPLYTLLSALFARLPGVPALVGLNLLSASAAALCALPVDALARRFTKAAPWQRFLALLTVGALTPLWDQATRIEVYAPATFLSLILLARGARTVGFGGDAPRTGPLTWLVLGVLAGAMAGVNVIFAFAAALAVGLCALPSLWRAGPARLLSAVGAATLGGLCVTILAYAYLFWARDNSGAFVWGDLHSIAGWKAFLTGADYSHTEHGAWHLVPAHLLDWGVWLLGEGALPAVLLGLAGLALPAPRRAAVLFALPWVGGIAYSMTYGVFHPQIPDYNGYLAPGLWLSAVGLCALLAAGARRRVWLSPTLAVALLASALAMGERPVWRRSRAGVDGARALATAFVGELPPKAVLIAEADHLVFPLWYLGRHEALRPDVLLINGGFAASSWYWRYLHETANLPAIVLRAPSTGVRLRRLVDALPGRRVFVESSRAASEIGLLPCPATWGFELLRPGQTCVPDPDAPGRFEQIMAGWWAGPTGNDLIGERVLAAVAHERARGFWALGDASGALRALRAGVRTGWDLPVPEGLQRPPQAPPWVETEELIGDSTFNRMLGATVLKWLGQVDAAARWAAETE